MSELRKLFVFVTTSTCWDIHTDSSIRLVYESRDRMQAFEFGNRLCGKSEQGQTQMYSFDFPFKNIDIRDISGENFKLVAAGNAAWLPGSIFIIGKTNLNFFSLIVALDRWPEDAWLCGELSNRKDKVAIARTLNLSATPTTA